MPALFIISGILFKPRKWTNTIISFAIPVFIFSLINAVFLFIEGDFSISQENYKSIILRFMQYRYGLGDCLFPGVWFVWTLFGLRFVSGDVYRIKSNKTYNLIGLLISIVIFLYMDFYQNKMPLDTIFHGYYLARVLPCFPFFFLGIQLRSRITDLPKILNKRFAFVLFILFILCPLIVGKCDINSNSYHYSYLRFSILAICSTLLLFYISINIKPIKFFEIISKGTLLILGSHIFLFRILDMVIPQSINFIVPFITILATYYPIVFLDKHCPLLLGKIRSVKQQSKV